MQQLLHFSRTVAQGGIPVQQLLHLATMSVASSTHSIPVPLRNPVAGDGGGIMMQTWLVFIPQLPASPSSLRVLVWRRMRAAGAAALQQGVWGLPQTPEHERFLHDVLMEVQKQGGSGILLVATPLDADRASEIVERFRADRDQEYLEFGVRCRDFLAEIAKETAARNLTFAALEENEHDLQKLHNWLGKIRARDFFGAPQAHAAAEALAACESALHGFAEAIYAREGLQGDAEDERGS
jgi:hypothetical protein